MAFAVVFPGQGSQCVGMLSDLAQSDAEIRNTFAEASAVLEYDLWKVVRTGPQHRLDRTEVTQPAMLAAGIAVWRSWQERGGATPLVVAGHSLGEYTALVAAGALSFRQAITLVRARGKYMQEAVPAGLGAMAAVIGLDEKTLADVCTEAAEGDVVTCANFNAPGQVVIAGHRNAVRRAVDVASGFGAKRAVELPVSAPFHCELMQPAAERLERDLHNVNIAVPKIPVVQNVDAQIHEDPDSIRQALILQAYKPVKWVDCIRTILGEGVDTIFEFGPGRVLTGLCRRIDKGIRCMAVYDQKGFEEALDAGTDA
jgi:[acyl-carrier-protein] S-malonyltransferase